MTTNDFATILANLNAVDLGTVPEVSPDEIYSRQALTFSWFEADDRAYEFNAREDYLAILRREHDDPCAGVDYEDSDDVQDEQQDWDDIAL